MDATYNFSLGFAQGRESKTETPNQLFSRQALQMISTGVSLISLSLGFSIFGILIIVNQHQADLNDLSGNSFLATTGGVGAILVGAACLWRELGEILVGLGGRFADSRVVNQEVPRVASNKQLLARNWPPRAVKL